MKIETDISSTGIESKIIYNPFDKALESSAEDGCEPISLPQNAESRIQQGKNAEISTEGNWVIERVLYIPKEGNKLITIPQSLKSAKKATQAHRAVTEFYLTRDEAEQLLTDSIDFPEETIYIPTEELDLEQLTANIFGGEDEARAYGEFLDNAGIKDLPIYAVDKAYVNKQTLPFVRQMWFRNLDGMSMLYSVWGLHYPDRIRVVRKAKPIKKQRQAFF